MCTLNQRQLVEITLKNKYMAQASVGMQKASNPPKFNPWDIVFLQVHVMGGEVVKIDPDEYELVKEAREKGVWVKVRQGEINGNSISLIKADVQRTAEYRKYVESVENSNKYKGPDEKPEPYPTPRLLPDIFKSINVSADVYNRIAESSDSMKLETGKVSKIPLLDSNFLD